MIYSKCVFDEPLTLMMMIYIYSNAHLSLLSGVPSDTVARRVPFYSPRMGRRSSEEHAAATGVLAGHSGALRCPADDLMIPGAAGASVPRIGPRPQSLRLSDTPGRDLWVSMISLISANARLGTNMNIRLGIVCSPRGLYHIIPIYQFVIYIAVFV